MKDYKNFIEIWKNSWKALLALSWYLIKLFILFLKIFFILPFKPLYDLWKDYLSKVKNELHWLSFKNFWKEKSKINDEVIIYTLSFMFLLFFTLYTVLWTPYSWYSSYNSNKIKEKYLNEFVINYNNDIHWFTEKYSKEIYEWFNQYNRAYNNRDCEFMKYVSVDLLQWEKNYIKNIPVDKKYNEEYVFREDYNCSSFDDINIKSIWSPIDVKIEIKETNNWKNRIIIANWYFAHSKIKDLEYLGLSKRKFTLRKLDNWKTWRIHDSKPIK